MNQIPGAITDSTTVPTSLPGPRQVAHLPARSSPPQLTVLPMPVVYAMSASSGANGAITAIQGSEDWRPAPESGSNPFYRPVPRGLTPLGRAAYTGDLEQVKALIQQGCKVDVLETGAGDGYTPLSVAAENGHTGIVEALLKAGADINLKQGNFGDTALMRAAERGHQDIVCLLLQQKGIRVDDARRDGETAFYCAAVNGHAAVAEMLFDKSVLTSRVKTELMVSACRSGKLAIVKLLHLRGGLGLAELEAHECLHIAASSRQAEVLAYLLGAGMDAQATDRRGRSPLQSACWGGSVPVVELLMAHAGVECNATASVLTQPLHYIAAAAGYRELLDYLLKPGVDPNLRDVGSGLTPLMAAACTGRVDVMRSLLACPGLEIDLVIPNPRANPDTSAERTALELAISENKRDAAVCLLKAGAKVAWPTEVGYRNSVLGWAIEHRDCDMLRLVLERCAASFGPGNVRCDAAMNQAAEERCADIVECLLEAGHAVAVPDESISLIYGLWGKEGHAVAMSKVAEVKALRADIMAADHSDEARHMFEIRASMLERYARTIVIADLALYHAPASGLWPGAGATLASPLETFDRLVSPFVSAVPAEGASRAQLLLHLHEQGVLVTVALPILNRLTGRNEGLALLAGADATANARQKAIYYAAALSLLQALEPDGATCKVYASACISANGVERLERAAQEQLSTLQKLAIEAGAMLCGEVLGAIVPACIEHTDGGLEVDIGALSARLVVAGLIRPLANVVAESWHITVNVLKSASPPLPSGATPMRNGPMVDETMNTVAEPLFAKTLQAELRKPKVVSELREMSLVAGTDFALDPLFQRQIELLKDYCSQLLES